MGALPSVRGEHTPLRLPPAARGRRLNCHGFPVVLRRSSRFAAQLQGYFVGNIVALVAVLPLGIACINLWGMNGVSFAGTAACAIGSLIMGAYLRGKLREL